MKKNVLILIGITIAALTHGQTIKIQGGTSISTLNWSLNGVNIDPLFNESLTGYSIFAGLDYLDMQYFNLSSNIGMIRRGGKNEFQLLNQNGELIKSITEKASLDYLSINTMIDLKYTIKKNVSPFISFGPRFDYLIASSKHFNTLKNIGKLNNTSIGLILGGGLKYDISKIQIGLRADYYLNFTKVADWTFENSGTGGEVTDKSLTINLTFGYKLK